VTDALGVTDPRVLANRIQQNHHHALALDDGLHDEAPAGSGDVSGLLQADIPVGACSQAVRITVADHAPAHRQRKFAADRVFADHLVLISGLDEPNQVVCAGAIVR
jgi:hypothetical protein